MMIVDHIAIRVDDLKIAEEWYVEHTAAEVTFRDDKYTRLKVKNTNIALIDKKFYPHAHIAVVVETQKELPLDKGEVIQHRDGTIGVYVKDPFGNYLEYIWYSKEQKEVFLSND